MPAQTGNLVGVRKNEGRSSDCGGGGGGGGDLQCHIQGCHITRLEEQLWAAMRHASLTAIISHTDLRNVSLYLFCKDSPSSSLTCQHHCWPAPTSGLRGFRGPSLFLFLISLPTIFLETRGIGCDEVDPQVLHYHFVLLLPLCEIFQTHGGRVFAQWLAVPNPNLCRLHNLGQYTKCWAGVWVQVSVVYSASDKQAAAACTRLGQLEDRIG